jgi:hypothetical protein
MVSEFASHYKLWNNSLLYIPMASQCVLKNYSLHHTTALQRIYTCKLTLTFYYSFYEPISSYDQRQVKITSSLETTYDTGY